MNTNRVTVADIEFAVEALYPPQLAQDWDKVGLICGDRTNEVKRVLVATDPIADVIDEAIELDADFILTHHPLYLRGASFFTAQDPKGNVVHRLIQSGCALMNAHTNADSAAGGVAVALAELIGLRNYEVMEPLAGFTIADCAASVISTDGTDLIGTGAATDAVGLGRIGNIDPMTLDDLAHHVANVLPASPHGIFVGGDLNDMVSRVAVSGGAGDSMLDLARQLGADVFITSDLRHHPASEHLENGQPYLICGSHWATESPWVPWAVKALNQQLPQLDIRASGVVSEPWTAHYPTTGGSR